MKHVPPLTSIVRAGSLVWNGTSCMVKQSKRAKHQMMKSRGTVMKSVNAFFLPAVKKTKYYCEGETSQTSGREQAGELNVKRNNTHEGQSTSSQGMQGLWFVLKNYMSCRLQTVCDCFFKLARLQWYDSILILLILQYATFKFLLSTKLRSLHQGH